MPSFPNMTFDLDLWPTDLKISRDHLIKDYLPTKFEASWAKPSWVISCTRLRETDRHVQRNMHLLFQRGGGHKYNQMTFDFLFTRWLPHLSIMTGLLFPKSVGFILLSWLTCLPDLLKMHITVQSLLYLGSSSGVVVKFLACRASGPGFDSRSRTYNFRDWLSAASKSRYGWNIAEDVNPQHNQPNDQSSLCSKVKVWHGQSDKTTLVWLYPLTLQWIARGKWIGSIQRLLH